MPDDKIMSPLRNFMARSFSGRDLADDDDIFALGFGNSLFAIELLAFVESEFNVEIDSEDLDMANFRSVLAVSDLVERKLAAEAQD